MLDASGSSFAFSPPQSQTIALRSYGADGFLAVEDTTYADGTRTILQYAVQIDSREWPTSGSARIMVQAADTVSLTRVDEATVKWTYKRDGAVALTAVGELSPDGNVWSLTTNDDHRLVYIRTG
jgi:hypothetical protein